MIKKVITRINISKVKNREYHEANLLGFRDILCFYWLLEVSSLRAAS